MPKDIEIELDAEVVTMRPEFLMGRVIKKLIDLSHEIEELREELDGQTRNPPQGS